MNVVAELFMTSFQHTPVLLDAVLAQLDSVLAREHALIVDATVGGGGHAEAMLRASPTLRLIGLDRDPAAITAARERLAAFAPRVRLIHAPFGALPQVLAGVCADAVLVDLGVSSHQLDTPTRGFSFQTDAPLDMRMDTTTGETVADLLARSDVDTLALILRELGEERHARRVARAILAARPASTRALAALVQRIVPRAPGGIHPATRTFQALRMAVNDELGQLHAWLQALPELLANGGLALAITFHSLEDRAVKHALRGYADPCTCPKAVPVCVCGLAPTFAVLTPRAIRPTPDEVVANPRARSAKLRAARRLRRQP